MRFQVNTIVGLIAAASVLSFASPVPSPNINDARVSFPQSETLGKRMDPAICTATSTSIFRTAYCTVTKFANRGTPTVVTWTGAQVFTLANDLWTQVANGGNNGGVLSADVAQGSSTFKVEIVLSSPYTTTWDALGNKVTFSALYDAILLSAKDGWTSSRNAYAITMNNNLERVATIYVSMFNCLS